MQMIFNTFPLNGSLTRIINLKTTKMKRLQLRTIVTALILIMSTSIHAGEKANKDLKNKEFIEKETKQIEETVKTYILGGDQQDVNLLETVMHNNYRVIINDAKENTIKELSKSSYLDFIAKKVFGGNPREIEIEAIEISKELNAVVKLKLTSSKAKFYSQFSLVKVNGKWWILQDLVFMEMR